MKRYSQNKKLNGLLNDIREQLEDLGIEEIEHYYKEFKWLKDHNIVQYGNLYCYYSQVRELYQRHNYKTMEKWGDEKIWETYKRQVGYVARDMLREKGLI